MPIDVEHVAWLARLAVPEEEKELMASQLGRILEYMAKLEELDTTGVPPTFHALEGMQCSLRDDVSHPGLHPEQALANAPDPVDELFRVPRVGEDES
ncbi:MAG TPA: Asp-tRNA(Asn)/Glu-tRNA(Gln) amidotransferase subunit GatC [Firmicutes bacterium]|nr:Asp-tRNA(Asn)/Glu-tRNA(Gln) amidotransferase subunit GatC [Bacillota bacterium]